MGLLEAVKIVLSFLVGFILTIVPLPNWALWARPQWVFLILLFWVLAKPQMVGVFAAFFVGLFMDLLTGTLLGQHAFAFTAVIYLVIAFHPQLKLFPLWQQLGTIFVLTVLQLALQCWILGIVGELPKTWGYWLSGVTSMLIWPWFYFLLKDGHEMVKDFG